MQQYSNEETSLGKTCASSRDGIPGDVDSLHKNIAIIDERLDHLIGRINPILRPAVPQPQAGGGIEKAHNTTSDLSSELRAIKGKLQRIISQIADLHDRVDL